MQPLRESDFRCHDARLVKVLPNREMEAVNYAIELASAGSCDGLFVQGKEIKDWRFIRHVEPLRRFIFSDVSKSFSTIDLSSLSGAEELAISGVSKAINFSKFTRMKNLGYQWSPRATDLNKLIHLERVDLWGIGHAKNAKPLGIPNGVAELRIVRYLHEELILCEDLPRLTSLSISKARNLIELPDIPSLRVLDLYQVGRSTFNYLSLPADLNELYIEDCAEIDSWDFLKKLRKLKKIVVGKTKCAELLESDLMALKGIEVVDIAVQQAPLAKRKI